MFLKRVQVPDFRALKNVDISFEQQLTPHVFPVGSQNGGGKSTLLQLIFVLLHCAIKPTTTSLLNNFLQGFKISNNVNQRNIAYIEIVDDQQKIIKLNFMAVSNNFLIKKLELYRKIVEGDERLHEENSSLLDWMDERIDDAFEDIGKIGQLEEKIQDLSKRISYLENRQSGGGLKQNKSLNNLPAELERVQSLRKSILALQKHITTILEYFNIVYLSRYSYEYNSCDEGGFVICEIETSPNEDEDEMENIHSILNDISPKVFLAAPSTQVFLFMPPNSRKKLLTDPKKIDGNQYADDLQIVKAQIFNFFTYDFLSVENLINLFEKARNEDYALVVKTGEYGNAYHHLLEKMNSVLSGKNINSLEDLSGIRFLIDQDNQTIEIYPEDLSHGELKRFGVCMWLLSAEINNSIVLMDEIELALHPDWQYQIVRDLVDWGPTNQYILATHSYALCEALTPAHVQEIPPQLLSSSLSK